MTSGQTENLKVARPPVVLLAVAAATVLVGVALSWVLSGIITAVVGWALAGPAAMGLLAVFVQRDTAARSGLYSAPDWVKPAYWGAIVLSLVGVVLCALRIADWVGHL